MRKYRLEWWKILTIVLLYYTVIGGLLIPVPRLHILNESIRLNYFHVPMWFTMIFLFTYSVWSSVQFIRTGNVKYDDIAIESVNVAFLFGALGLLTGMLWANATWGTFWTSDPKLNNTTIGLLIYSAYFVLRKSLEDESLRARLSAVYNIFAYTVFIPLIFILPRMTDSLHPGSGDNPTFRLFDTAHNMKLVIYTAIIAFILTGWWLLKIFLRIRTIKKMHDEII